MAEAALNLPQSTELVLLRSTVAKVEFNIDELRANVREALKEYDLVVTVDTVKGAKELMADLNKKAKGMNDVFKEAAAKVTAPVTEAERQIKELAKEISEARDKLKQQVDVFEAERKAEGRKALIEAQAALWESEGVEPEFRRSTIDKLVSLSCLTAKGSLTGSTAAKLKDLVAADKALQVQTETRLLKLENASLRAGLKAVLTRAHVEAFLFEQDDVYQARLDHMLEAEKARQDATEAAARREFEEEQRQKQLQAQAAEKPSTPNRPKTPAEMTDEELAAELKQCVNLRAYCDDRETRAIYAEKAAAIEAEQKRRQPAAPVQQADKYMLCSIHDTSEVILVTDDHDEAIQAALSASVNRSEDQKPFYVAVWSKNYGRIAICDGLSGEVYQRVAA